MAHASEMAAENGAQADAPRTGDLSMLAPGAAEKIQQGISYKKVGNEAFLKKDYVGALRSYHFAGLVRRATYPVPCWSRSNTRRRIVCAGGPCSAEPGRWCTRRPPRAEPSALQRMSYG